MITKKFAIVITGCSKDTGYTYTLEINNPFCDTIEEAVAILDAKKSIGDQQYIIVECCQYTRT